MRKLIFAGAAVGVVAGLSGVAYCQAAEPPIAPLSMELTRSGEDLLQARESIDAIGQFETALAVDPKNVRAYIGLARAHDQLGLPGRAVKFYREGLMIDPNNLTALEEQGEAFVDRGAVSRAKDNLERIRKLCQRECDEAAALAEVIAKGPPPVETVAENQTDTRPVTN